MRTVLLYHVMRRPPVSYSKTWASLPSKSECHMPILLEGDSIAGLPISEGEEHFNRILTNLLKTMPKIILFWGNLARVAVYYDKLSTIFSKEGVSEYKCCLKYFKLASIA